MLVLQPPGSSSAGAGAGEIRGGADDVEVAAEIEGVGTWTASRTITWTPTVIDMGSGQSATIRRGDSLLLVTEEASGILEIDLDYDGIDFTPGLSGPAGAPIPAEFGAAGEFTVHARVDGVYAGQMTVVAIGVGPITPIACQVGFEREKEVEVDPVARTGDVAFGALDPDELQVTLGGLTGTGRLLFLRALCRGTPVLTARVNGPAGPVVAYREVDEFTQESTSEYLLVTQPEEGGSVGAATLTMTPLITYTDAQYNPTVKFTVCTPGVTFDGGETEVAVGAGDFLLNLDGSGSYTMNLHLAEGVTVFCRTSVFYQAGSEPKRISFGSPENGDWIEFRVNEKTWCEAKNSDESIARADLETMTGGGWGYATTRQFDVWLVKEGAVPPARIGKTGLSVSRKTEWTEVEEILDGAALNTGGVADQGALVKLHALALAAGRYTLCVQWVVSSSPVTFPGAVNVLRMEPVLYGVKQAGESVYSTPSGWTWAEGRDRFLFHATDAWVRFRCEYGGDQAAKALFDKNLRWSLPELEGLGRVGYPAWSEDPQSAKGAGSTTSYHSITYKGSSGKPAKNSAFGEKVLTAELYDDAHQKVLLKVETKLRLFFRRFETTNFGYGSVAKWYHYYSKEGNPGACKYSRTAGDADYAKYGGGGGGKKGEYKPDTNEIVLYDGATTPFPGPVVFPEGTGAPASWVAWRYNPQNPTDVVNISYAHEKTHRITIQATGWPAQPRPERDDRDGDCVPDTWERKVAGMRDDRSDTFGTHFTGSNTSGAPRDNEFYAWMSGAYMPEVGEFTANAPSEYHGAKPPRSAYEQDWALNGYNWNLEH